jgi:hypothetical protein
MVRVVIQSLLLRIFLLAKQPFYENTCESAGISCYITDLGSYRSKSLHIGRYFSQRIDVSQNACTLAVFRCPLPLPVSFLIAGHGD